MRAHVRLRRVCACACGAVCVRECACVRARVNVVNCVRVRACVSVTPPTFFAPMMQKMERPACSRVSEFVELSFLEFVSFRVVSFCFGSFPILFSVDHKQTPAH